MNGGVSSLLVKRQIAVGLGLALVHVVTAALAFFLGDKHATDGMSIKRVTATEIANAMKDDRFYADYGPSTLLVAGTVSSLSMRGGDVIAEFATDSSFQTLCDLGAQPSRRPVWWWPIWIARARAGGQSSPAAYLS